MDAQRLLEYIKNPLALKAAAAGDMEALARQYPWCQTAHLLCVKTLFEQKHPAYPSQLKRTAAYLPDRSILYYLIHDGIQQKTGIAGYSSVVRGTTPLISGNDRTEAAISGSAMDGLIIRLRKLSEVNLADIDHLLEKIENLKDSFERKIREVVDAFLLEREEMLQRPQAIREKIDRMNQECQKEAETNESGGSDTDELIQRFLQNNPSISRPRKDFYNPADMAHHSTMDHEDIVSETLAEVHIKQGYIQKAIKIYQQLSLIIPEKSTYFAARIKNLKSEHKLL